MGGSKACLRVGHCSWATRACCTMGKRSAKVTRPRRACREAGGAAWEEAAARQQLAVITQTHARGNGRVS